MVSKSLCFLALVSVVHAVSAAPSGFDKPAAVPVCAYNGIDLSQLTPYTDMTAESGGFKYFLNMCGSARQATANCALDGGMICQRDSSGYEYTLGVWRSVPAAASPDPVWKQDDAGRTVLAFANGPEDCYVPGTVCSPPSASSLARPRYQIVLSP